MESFRVGAGSGGATAPEEVGGQAEQKENDGGEDVLERGRVVEGEDDGVGDDGGGRQDEDERCERVAGDAVGDRLSLVARRSGKIAAAPRP